MGYGDTKYDASGNKSSWEGPDFENPKGFIVRHNFPECFGSTRTEQLRSKLTLGGFKRIRLTRPAGGSLGIWKIEMYADANYSRPSSRIIIAEIVNIAEVLGFQLDQTNMRIELAGRRIKVSFLALS